MARYRYRGKLGRNRRPHESTANLRPLVLDSLGLPRSADDTALAKALMARHVPFATEAKPTATKPPGRPRSIDPFIEESLVFFIHDELAKKPRPLLTICKEMADEFGLKPRTMVRIYETRKERDQLEQERARLERNEIAKALQAYRTMPKPRKR